MCENESSDSCLGEIQSFNSKMLAERLFGLFLDLIIRFLLDLLDLL